MKITEIRAITGLNKTDFAKKYNIPFRTVQNWELGTRECPEYVLELLERVVKEDFKEARDMTVSEIIEKENGNYAEVEVWQYTDKSHRLHSDFIRNIDGQYAIDCYEFCEAHDYRIMDEEEYNATVLANTSEYADFDSWYGNKDAKVLVIMIDHNKEF